MGQSEGWLCRSLLRPGEGLEEPVREREWYKCGWGVRSTALRVSCCCGGPRQNSWAASGRGLSLLFPCRARSAFLGGDCRPWLQRPDRNPVILHLPAWGWTTQLPGARRLDKQFDPLKSEVSKRENLSWSMPSFSFRISGRGTDCSCALFPPRPPTSDQNLSFLLKKFGEGLTVI